MDVVGDAGLRAAQDRASLAPLKVFVPTRGRPESAERLLKGFLLSTRAEPVFIVDTDDPALTEYRSLFNERKCSWIVSPSGPRGIVWPLNYAVNVFLRHQDPDARYFGFMGDDHLPRTLWWDRPIIDELDRLGTGLVYCNDLLQKEKLPTAVFMTADIPMVLGYMAPPALNHLWVDNYWLDLGKAIDRITYLPEVIVEHLHPINLKSPWDDTYEVANSSNAEHDWRAYSAYKAQGALGADIEKVMTLL